METAGGASSKSYACVLACKLTHAPRTPSKSGDLINAENLPRKERVERELVATTSHFGRFVEFHPTKARLKEELQDTLYTSNVKFLINKQVVEVKLDKDKVLEEIILTRVDSLLVQFVDSSSRKRNGQLEISVLYQ